MSKSLSQIVAELFSKPAEGKELSSQIQRLGVEIRNVVQSEETVFGKFHGLLKSLQEIIPDEQQRDQAALKALSTTSKMSRQEIIKAVNAQIEEMKIVEKSVLPSLPAWRDELKTMEARAQERKGEMAKLRERMAQLERRKNGPCSQGGAGKGPGDRREDHTGHLREYQSGDSFLEHEGGGDSRGRSGSAASPRCPAAGSHETRCSRREEGKREPCCSCACAG
jgi:hypothetical protein